MDNTGLRVIIAFILDLIIIYATAKVIGEENKQKWFKKRTKYTLFTRRGFLGEACHFGYPCTRQGFLVTIIMFGLIFVLSYAIIFLI